MDRHPERDKIQAAADRQDGSDQIWDRMRESGKADWSGGRMGCAVQHPQYGILPEQDAVSDV